MAYLSPVLTIAVGAVKKAANALIRDFNELEHLQAGVHNDGMFAMRSYEKVKNILQDELKKIRPNCAFVTDNESSIPVDGNYFAVCPIDGFFNFAHGNSNFAVSAALVENNNVVAGVVYAPITDELFFAEKGYGAFKEGFRSQERLRVSKCKNMEQALIAGGADAQILTKILGISSHLLVSGCTSLDMAYMAAAKVDAVVSAHNSAMELAAGMLLIKEAGGYIFAAGDTDIRSENLTKVLYSGGVVAANEALRQKIAEQMAG